MSTLLRHRPSPAMVVACIALAIALGGTSYAAIMLPVNSVGTKQLKKNAVKRSKIAAKAVDGSKVAPDSLTGANILESSLGTVPSATNATNATTATNATHATSADSATSATNASHATSADSATNATHATTADTAAPTGSAGGDLTGSYPSPTIAAGAVSTSKIGNLQVTGAKVANNTLGATQINETSLDYASAGCQLGLIHSFARIRGDAAMPLTYTTGSAYVDLAHNCGGGTTEVRRGGAGNYFIRFNGDGAALALAVSNWDYSCVNTNGLDNFVTVTRITTGADAGAFFVSSKDAGGLVEEACVTVVTF